MSIVPPEADVEEGVAGREDSLQLLQARLQPVGGGGRDCEASEPGGATADADDPGETREGASAGASLAEALGDRNSGVAGRGMHHGPRLAVSELEDYLSRETVGPAARCQRAAAPIAV